MSEKEEEPEEPKGHSNKGGGMAGVEDAMDDSKYHLICF